MDYPKETNHLYLLEGFQFGFVIPYEGPCILFMACYLTSVNGMEQIVWEKIETEKREARVLGPFLLPIPIFNTYVCVYVCFLVYVFVSASILPSPGGSGQFTILKIT